MWPSGNARFPAREEYTGADDLGRDDASTVSLAGRPLTHLACVIAALLPLAVSDGASADEAGVSFWLQGQYGSFAAVPSNPGWSFESTSYHAKAAASAGVSFARGGGFQAGMKSPTDFVMVTLDACVRNAGLGGQAAVGVTALYGRNTTSVSSTLTGPGGASLSGSRSDYVAGFGDLYPAATLKWNQDVHNFMVYATACGSRRRLRSDPPGDHGTQALGDRRGRRLHLSERADRIRMVRGRRAHLQFHQSLHPIPERHRRALGIRATFRRISRKNYTSAPSAMPTTS